MEVSAPPTAEALTALVLLDFLGENARMTIAHAPKALVRMADSAATSKMIDRTIPTHSLLTVCAQKSTKGSNARKKSTHAPTFNAKMEDNALLQGSNGAARALDCLKVG